MPILKHAKKKLKQDKKRTTNNRKIKDTYKSLVKKAKEKTTKDTLSKAFSAVDKAAKQNILSKNKAARMKSSLSRQAGKPAAVATPAKVKAHSTNSGQAKTATKKATKSAAKSAKSSGAKKKPASKKK